MVARFLVTTADERTWPADQPILFLGEWCRLYDRRHVWDKLDAQVVPYHWDDRAKMYGDYKSLSVLYEELLDELAKKLNEIHGTAYAPRYWRILVGPWLGYFIQILFDRWSMLKRALDGHAIAGAKLLEVQPSAVVPDGMAQFQHLMTRDEWNGALYGELLQRTGVRLELVRSKDNFHPPVRALSRPAVRWADRLSGWFTRPREAFFMSTYLPLASDVRLQWRLGQVPKRWRPARLPDSQIDMNTRQWRMTDTAAADFPGIVRSMIPRHIPKAYLEGYASLVRECKQLPWPRKPSVIFTSNAHYADDVFKQWAAHKVVQGAPLAIGQHGGHYRVGRWSFVEDHELAISDVWLAWGLVPGDDARIKPVGNLKAAGRRQGWDARGFALLVESTVPRYSYYMFSIPIASQWLSYFDDQTRFVAALPDALQRQLLVRLHRAEYGWSEQSRWRERFRELHIDEGTVPLTDLIQKSRVYISTYNTTTYLESLALNVPSIIFWDPRYSELRESAIPRFEQLKTVGIFHESPESAARHLARIWDDVAAWWQSDAVQTARAEFCRHYCAIPEKPVDLIASVFTKLK